MGKVIKSDRPVLPVTEPPVFQGEAGAAPKEAKPLPQAPQGYVLPLEEYAPTLKRAEALAQEKRYAECLQDLLNLEVSRFDKLRPHELLAEAYLHLGHIDLAKEQCAHCADILARENPEITAFTHSFEQLIAEAGDPVETERAYNQLMDKAVTEDYFFEGSKTAIHLAAHRMNEERYQEAEALLTAFRDRCLAVIAEE